MSRIDYPDFYIKNKQIFIKKHVKTAKPITGTKIGAVTKDNPFQTPFVAFMDMYRFSLPFEMTKEMETGINYEPHVIAAVNKIEQMHFNNYSNNLYYDFDGEEEIFKQYNGKIDGWDENKKIVLECKVTKFSNLPKWIKNGPPKYYLLQMALYGYLARANEIWLVGYFVKTHEYEAPIPEELDWQRLRIWKYNYATEKKTTFVERKLAITTLFLKNHIDLRVSPKFNVAKNCDRELLDHLGINY